MQIHTFADALQHGCAGFGDTRYYQSQGFLLMAMDSFKKLLDLVMPVRPFLRRMHPYQIVLRAQSASPGQPDDAGGGTGLLLPYASPADAQLLGIHQINKLMDDVYQHH